jgi:hypothetical protein
MFKIIKRNLLLIALLCNCSLLQAAIPNTDNPTSYVGTTAKGKFSHLIGDNSAFSVLGEAGPRNYRVGATLGWQFYDNQRLKISGEFLEQDIKYAFFSGTSREWVKQGAFGAHYQYDLNHYRYSPQFNLKAGYSHAPSKQLSFVQGFYNRLGKTQKFIDNRRIAGSDAGFVSPGLSIMPWQTGRIGADLNYDDVKYDTNFPVYQRAHGFGGTALFTQQLGMNTELDLSAGFRTPFNMYQATIAYTLPSRPNWTLGVDANYVDGKHYLPNTYNVGLSVRYAVKEIQLNANYLDKDAPLSRSYNPLSSWINEPAIYLPQVLAIADSSVDLPQPPPAPTCSPLILVGTIPQQTMVSPTMIPTNNIFSGTPPFTYTVSISDVSTGAVTPTVSIDSFGTILVNPNPTGTGGVNYTFTVNVTATNACGTASTSFPVSAPLDSGLP